MTGFAKYDADSEMVVGVLGLTRRNLPTWALFSPELIFGVIRLNGPTDDKFVDLVCRQLDHLLDPTLLVHVNRHRPDLSKMPIHVADLAGIPGMNFNKLACGTVMTIVDIDLRKGMHCFLIMVNHLGTDRVLLINSLMRFLALPDPAADRQTVFSIQKMLYEKYNDFLDIDICGDVNDQNLVSANDLLQDIYNHHYDDDPAFCKARAGQRINNIKRYLDTFPRCCDHEKAQAMIGLLEQVHE